MLYTKLPIIRPIIVHFSLLFTIFSPYICFHLYVLFIYLYNFVLFFVYYSIRVIFCVFHVLISCNVRSSLWLLCCNKCVYNSHVFWISGYSALVDSDCYPLALSVSAMVEYTRRWKLSAWNFSVTVTVNWQLLFSYYCISVTTLLLT